MRNERLEEKECNNRITNWYYKDDNSEYEDDYISIWQRGQGGTKSVSSRDRMSFPHSETSQCKYQGINVKLWRT